MSKLPSSGGFIPMKAMGSTYATTDQQAGLSESEKNNDHIVEINEKGQLIGRPSLEHQGTTDTKDGIFHKHRGRRRGRGSGLANDEETLTTMGKLYGRVLNFSIITRYLLYIIPLSLCFVTVILVGIFVVPHAAIGANDKTKGVRIVWFFVWLNVIWCSLWISKLCAKALPFIFQTLVGAVNSSVKKYALVIKALEVPISLVGWAIASLCSFLPLMTQNPDQIRAGDRDIHEWQIRVNLGLIACFISSMIYLGEKLIIQIISVSYHRRQFAERIRTNKENIKMLTSLYEHSIKLFPLFTEFVHEDSIISQPLASNLIMPQAGEGPTAPMHAIIENINVMHDRVTSVFGGIAQEVTGNKNVFNATSARSVIVDALQTKRSAEALARRIWMSFVSEGNDALEAKDLVEVMGPEKEQVAQECFSYIDADENGDVSLEEMEMYVVHIHTETEDVERSMQDVDNAIRTLDNVLGFIVFAAVVLVFVVIQQQSGMGPALAGVGTFLISAAFALGPTIQEILGSCIFLFLKHPFDVGDRVDIAGKKYIVEKISLLYSIFKCVEDQKVTQAPNNVLNTLWIENISRSKFMTETIAINVNYDTSLEDIKKLNEDLLLFIKENSRDFQQDLTVQVAGINDLDKMTIKLDIKHKSNWSNGLLALQRRNKFFCALVLIMKGIPIYGAGGGFAAIGEEGKPMYTVAITDDKAQENMKNQTKSKLSKRWDAKKEEEEVKELREPMDRAAKGKEVDTPPVVSPVLLSVLEPRLGRAGSRSENVGGLIKKESTKGRRKRSASPASTRGHSQFQPQQ